MSNQTVGNISQFNWHQYLLGGFLFVTFNAIVVLNMMILKCFYNLRNLPFVRNSKAVISLAVTDLLNAIIMTPTLLSWFLLPPPCSYEICVMKSLPFMLSNYASALNMAACCVYRLLVIKKVTVGQLNVRSTGYGIATLGLWAVAILCVSLPYVVWNKSGRVILDCRRMLFSDIKKTLTFFAFLYDIPIVTMNVCLLVMIVIYKKYKTKVCIFSEDPRSGPREISIKPVVQIYRCLPQSRNDNLAKTSFNYVNGNHVTGDSRSHNALFANDLTDEITIHVTFPKSETNHPFDSHYAISQEIRTEKDVEVSQEVSANKDIDVSAAGEKGTHTPSEQQATSQTSDVNRAEENVRISTDSSNCMQNELKQFLITMGVLVVVYDLTVVPLIIDLNMGARDPNFLVPDILNSMCFLNSFCHPVVYLVRMKTMRQEMKQIVRHIWNKILSMTGIMCNC